MDGVLADFDAAAAGIDNVCGNDLNRQTKEMDAVALNAKKMRWRRIEEKPTFWRDMPVMCGIDALVRVAAGRGEIFVLTKAPGAKNFAGGDVYVDFIEDEKRDWISRNMSEFFDNAHVIVARIAKEELLHPGYDDILIDDRAGNVADWCAAGGRGIVFRDVDSAIKELTLADS